ncbi:MAG: beta-propeller fold lactonase family protein [Chloroflexi bacterium]|nr:beta-propeller fold lactonase family protein [Chloroflexota bacterium]
MPSKHLHLLFRVVIVVLLAFLSSCGGSAQPTSTSNSTPLPETAATIAKNPSYSSPIAISDDDSLLVVANTLNGTISLINVAGDANAKLTEIQTGDEPRSVVITPNKAFAYVTNQASGTVSVIDLGSQAKVTDISVGGEPYGIALTPDASRAYVANSASGTVSIIDTASNSVVATISIPGVQPRGVAITNNNGGTGQQFVYVTQFLSQPTASGGPGLDQGSEGKVFVISSTDDAQIQGVITLAAHDTGFAADRTAFGGSDKEPTFAYPNQLQSIVLKNGRGYLPNVAASPEGPVKFNVDTQAFLSVFDVAAKSELSGGTINLHAAVKTQTFTPKLFVANPWAVAFKHASNDGYVVSAASDVLVKITLDDNGVPSVVSVPAEGDTTRVSLVEVGKNPRGIVINNADTRAYVYNFISKDVSVVDLSASPEAELARVQSADLPAPGSDAAKFLAGNELFHSSRGEFDEGATERMSNEGWQACASCHPDGLSDGVVWAFASGPRKSIPLNGTFSPQNQTGNQRVLNYSAVFDELEDFELNIRGVSGGKGLIVLQGTADPDPNVKAFDPPNSGREQLHIGGFGAWDAIVAWTQFRVPSPVSAHRGVDPNGEVGQQIVLGRQLFTQANCQACHGGAKWSTPQVDYARVSPFPETITLGTAPEPPAGQLSRFLQLVGTFDPANSIEKNANNAQALGQLGFNPPSLLSISAFPPYFHNGSCLTLECVLENQTHREAGGVTGVLDDPASRAALVQFLISIDATTEPINP